MSRPTFRRTAAHSRPPADGIDSAGMPTAVLARPAQRRRRRTFAIQHVATVGSMLPTNVLERVAAEDRKLAGLRPSHYGLAASVRLDDAITRSRTRVTDIHRGFTADLDSAPLLDTAAHAGPHRLTQPDSWVGHSNATAGLAGKTDRTWLIGRRDICRSSDQRTLIASVLQFAAIGQTSSMMLSDAGPTLVAVFYAAATSFAAESLLRRKIGGTHLAYTSIRQTVLPRPTDLSARCPFDGCTTVAQWLLPSVLELTYTAWDLEPFAVDCGDSGPPFPWDGERRFPLRAELYAAFFHLDLSTPDEWSRNPSDALKSALPTPRDAVRYIMDTFPMVALKSSGTYRTKDTILEINDSMSAVIRTNFAYHSRLSTPPGVSAIRHARS